MFCKQNNFNLLNLFKGFNSFSKHFENFSRESSLLRKACDLGRPFQEKPPPGEPSLEKAPTPSKKSEKTDLLRMEIREVPSNKYIGKDEECSKPEKAWF